MELVRAASLTRYFEVAEGLCLATVPLLREAGLTRAMLINPEQMLPARAVIRLLERSAEASGCPTFGLHMAERRELADLGIVSLLIAHQTTLRDALAVLGQYRNRINSNLVLHVEEHEDVAVLREEFSINPPVLSRQTIDLALGVLEKVCASVVEVDWRPLHISLSYPRPEARDREIYRRMFPCPLEFGAEFDGIVLRRSDLDLRNPRANASMALHARSLVEAMMVSDELSVVQEVEQSIMLGLPAGRASIESTAHTLGINLRTLQRRLKSANTSYSDLLERVRAQQVSRHLANRRLRLTDVADMLGYASLGAFTRWYSDHFKETPSAARKRLQGGASG